jgi:putative membrane protein
MKICNDSMTRLLRVLRSGTVSSAALFTACALQAQYIGPVTGPGTTTPTPAPTADANGISHAAKDFMQFAAQANQTEIALANIAETRGQNAKVKELAQMMLADHQQNYGLLQGMAQNHLVALDSSLNWKNQRAVNRLQKAGIADFDKDYTTAMLEDHVKAIKRFDKAATGLDEQFVVQYAQNTLPDLRKHLRHSEDAARAVGVDEGAISSILKGLPSDELLRKVASNQN